MMGDINSQLEYYLCGWGILCWAIFGLLGNTFSILILKYRKVKMNQTFTNLLVWLAAIDSIFLVCVTLSFCLPSLSPSYKSSVFPLILPSLLPLTSVALSTSVYCVVALTLERYLHIARPQASNKGSFFGYILPVMVFSLLYNAPKFFEFTTEYTRNKNRELVPHVRATDFRKNVDYSLYVLGSNFIFMGLLPFLLLTSLTILHSLRVKRYYHVGERGYESMAVLLYSIVVVQLVCHAPRTGLNIFEIYQAMTGGSLSLSHPWLVDLSHLLLTISSASNVIIFTVQDNRFRSLITADLKKVLFLYRQSENSNEVLEEESTLVGEDLANVEEQNSQSAKNVHIYTDSSER